MTPLFDDPDGYYRVHSKIYNLTRWAFLFGRKRIIHQLLEHSQPQRILEIGCGTGRLIRTLNQRCTDTEIIGLDLSEHMLNQARSITAQNNNTIQFIHQDLHQFMHQNEQRFDAVLCSYSLSMLGDEKYPAVNGIRSLLSDDGLLAVVDFHGTPFGWFKTWMRMNHVDFDPDLYLTLGQHFNPIKARIRKAYFGWWEYFLFIGTRRGM
jgi:S-adenosylmethionine-diacylgycerolhomoserine-N-methlytransferase